MGAKSKAKAKAKPAGPKKVTPEPVCLIVQLEIQEDRVDDFLKAMTADMNGSRKEKGCLRFDLLRDPEASNKFVLYEVYKDADAVSSHREEPHFKVWGEFKATGAVKSQTVMKMSGYNYV